MESLLKKVTELMRNRKKNKRLKTIVTCLAMVVVFATTYALILPAITLDDETADMEPGIVLAQEENEQEKQPAEEPEEAENTDEPEETSNKEEDVVSDEEEETTPASEDTDDTATSDDAETAEAVDDETTDDEAAENETAETLTKTYLDAEIAIVATYGADANIPEEAEFLAKKLELDNKDTEADKKTERCRYDIGFYVDGKEIEPAATVSLRVRFLKGAFADTKGMTVVHYLDNDDPDNTETIQPKTKADADGNVQVEFDLDSFSVVEFQSEILANDGADAKANDTARAGKTVTVTFRANGGSGTVPTQQSVEAGETITFPEAGGLSRSGYAFVGWSTKSNHGGSADDVMESPIYQPNETYTVTDNTTFYAIWAETSTDAVFYIALDGVPRTEPRTVSDGSADAADFTWGVEIANALQEAKFYSNSSGVNSNLAAQPSAQQLVYMIQNALDDPKKTVTVGGITVTGVEVQNGKVIVTSSAGSALNNQELYVTWYVTKNASCGPILYDKSGNYKYGDPISNHWHVDGVLLTKAKVTLYYNANAPAGAYTKLPDGSQWTVNDTVKAGNHNHDNTNILTPERKDGYVFAGWKMYTRDTDGKFTVEGGIYQPSQEFTITKDTELRAQWVKDTTSLTVKKTDESGNLIDTAKFELSGKEESTANGVANFGTIELNTVYSLAETQAPDGYERREGTIYFKETKDGENYTVTFYKDDAGTKPITEQLDWLTYELTGSNLTLTISDERSMANITIKKVETGTTTALPGAEFTLYRPATDGESGTTISGINGNVVAERTSLVSNENGEISVTDLPIGGEYYLVETKAPDGYNLLTDAIHFTVGGTEITLNENNFAAANGYTLTVSNSAGHQLPNTGGSGTTLFTLGGLAILAGCLMTGYSMRRKQKGGCK